MTEVRAIEWLDGELAKLARCAGALRVRLAEGLEVLANIGGHHELGFPNVESYALERCERSARWVQESRALARRLKELPLVRHAVICGRISFSMAQVVAKFACPDDEAFWLAEAAGRTVRAMRKFAREHTQERDPPENPAHLSADAVEEKVILTVTVDREEVWLFESARMIVKRLGGATVEETVEALLAEGATTLLEGIDRAAIEPFDEANDERAPQRAWERELLRFREEAEVRCEAALARRLDEAANAQLTRPLTRMEESAAAPDGFDGCCDAQHIDGALRRISAELVQREIALGELAEKFWQTDGWRRLRYATESQYARERLGMSLSSVEAKRRLARRARSLPELREALRNRVLGYEAARLVAVVATPATIGAWTSRAKERTVRHLREEVETAQMLARLGIDPAMCPPAEATMREVAAIEGRVATAEMLPCPHQQPADVCAPNGIAAAATRRSLGRVTLRFRVGVGTARLYRWLERVFRRHGPRHVGFVRFLCMALIDSWKHTLSSDVAYAGVYARDGHRCTNPVCGRRDLTPHHLVFRSAGGDDSDENLASLCVWCHLEGVHTGRLGVSAPASAMTWRIGRTVHTVVDGRTRRAVDEVAA